ncbi:aminotransferase class IV [Pontibacter sp. MBLB2868]|uniref:aminotransferase class IV n=1 Tax=Pontibacter sp. MBLB2868 TaxID=3451555 RepID=UPI003F754AC0
MAEKPTLFAYLNSSFIPLSEACLHVSDLAIQRGYGVFDFIKVKGRKPLFLQQYLDRFHNSAGALYLRVPFQKQMLTTLIEELVHKNDLDTSGLKIILTGGYSENGYDPAEPNLLIQQQPLLLPPDELIQKGIKIITHEYVRELPQVKTINYTMGIRLQKAIREQEADEVLYHTNGIVTEFPRCNFFIVKQDGTVATPKHNVLPGITRRSVLELASKKYKVVEGEITLDEVYKAKEVFLTSTTKRILPIVKIGEKAIGRGIPGNVTLDLLQDLIAMEETYLAAH